MKTAYFDRFTIDLPDAAVEDCSHQGQCNEDVAFWSDKITLEASPDAIRAELREYGAWDDEKLADDKANKQRIIWIAAGNIREEQKQALNQ